MIRTSVIIPVRDRAALTRQCLEQLLAGDGSQDDVELVVVDDGSRDETAEMLSSYGERIRVVTHETSAGFAASCNDGAAASSGGYLVFLNNDTAGRSGWLEALVTYVQRNEQVAAAGSKLLYQNGTVEHAGLVISVDLMPRHIYRGFPGDHPAVSKSRPFQAVTGACMLVRRDRFEDAGGFDVAFENGFEDVDLCLRFAEAGHEVHYCHESVLVHFEAATRAEDTTLHEQNRLRFLERWGERIRSDELAMYVDDGLIDLVPGDLYPLEVRLSPLLAVVDNDELIRRTGELLSARSHQVFQLLRENTALRARLGEVGFEGTASPVDESLSALEPSTTD